MKTVADEIIVFGAGDSKDEAMKDHDRNFKHCQRHVSKEK